MSTTRRGFIAGAVASAAAPAVARGATPPPGIVQAKQQIVRRGRAVAVSADGKRMVVAHDGRSTIGLHRPGRKGGSVVDVGGHPVDVAVSPDGRLAAVTTGFWDKPALVLVDLRAGAVRKRLDVGPAPFTVAFAPGGRQVVVSGGEQEGTVHVVDVRKLRVTARNNVGLVPRGIAIVPGGKQAWIALNGDSKLVRVELKNGFVSRTLRTPQFPDRVAVSADGQRVLVSHSGPDSEYVTEIDVASRRLRRRTAGRLPSAVAWTKSGRRLVTLGGAGEVLSFGARGRPRRLRVSGAPRGLAVAGRRAWTVDALDGAIKGVRT